MLLSGIHQGFLADPVNHPGNPCGELVDLIQSTVSKNVFLAGGIGQLRGNVSFCISPVQMMQDNVHTLPLYEDLPSGSKSYIGMGCSGYGMTTACPEEKKEAVWDFLKYIVSVDGQNAFSAAGSGIPCLKALAQNPNAVFKQYLVTDDYYPNHEAFIAYPERDLPANYLKNFEVSKQLTIDKYVKDRTLNSFYKTSDRDKYFADYKTNMEKIWKK